MDEELYKQNILDHYKNPRNRGVLHDPTISQRGVNASCGDELEMYINFSDEGMVIEASYEGVGCAISQAAASMLTEKIEGLTLEKLKLITPGDIYDMLGIQVSPARSKCALLAYGALVEGLTHYETTKK